MRSPRAATAFDLALKLNDVEGKSSTDAGQDLSAVEPERTVEEKPRKCLVCHEHFLSAWAGERVCRRCKSSSAWRSGALR